MFSGFGHFPLQRPASRGRSRRRLPALARVRGAVWPHEADNPAHLKLLEQGAASLSNDQLLALALGAAQGRVRAPAAARGVAAAHEDAQSVSALFSASADRLARAGRGTRRWCKAQAWVELVRRSIGERLRHTDLLCSPEDVGRYLALTLQHRPREIFAVLFLDSRNRLLAFDELFQGTLNQTAVYPREVARRALEHNAAAVILAHNHPSGEVEPSSADRLLTQALQQALRCLDIAVLDHVIVAAGRRFSFAEQGLL